MTCFVQLESRVSSLLHYVDGCSFLACSPRNCYLRHVFVPRLLRTCDFVCVIMLRVIVVAVWELLETVVAWWHLRLTGQLSLGNLQLLDIKNCRLPRLITAAFAPSVSEAVAEVEREASVAAPKARRRCRLSASSCRRCLSRSSRSSLVSVCHFARLARWYSRFRFNSLASRMTSTGWSDAACRLRRRERAHNFGTGGTVSTASSLIARPCRNG